jgi:hypothetical protein
VYTFSKSIDDISSIFGGSAGSGLPQDSQNLSGDRGVSDFNAAHRATLSFVYDLPFQRMWARGPDWSRKVLDNWQAGGILTAQTGSPFTVILAGAPGAARLGRRSIQSRTGGGQPNLPGPGSGGDASELV